MANAKGHLPVANHTPNQISHISIKDPDNGKLKVGQAVSASGNDGSKYHQGMIVQTTNDGKKGVARLTCTQGPTGREEKSELPADGRLTITVTDGPTVDPIEVTYVDDSP